MLEIDRHTHHAVSVPFRTHTHTHAHTHTHTQSMGTLAFGWAIPRPSIQCAWDCVYDVSRNLDTISLSACVVCMRSCGTDGGLGSGQEGPLLLSARRTLTHVGHVCHGLLGTVYGIAECGGGGQSPCRSLVEPGVPRVLARVITLCS